MSLWKDARLLAIAEDLRLVYGACATKKIARDFGISLAAAALWLSGQIPASKRRQISAAICIELERTDVLRAAAYRRSREIVDEMDHKYSEVLGTRDRRPPQPDSTEAC